MRILTVTMECLSLIFLLPGCAGPTSPFGAINSVSKKAVKIVNEMRSPAAPSARLLFYPHHQVWHDVSDFKIVIEDLKGVPDNPDLKLIYNGIDVTRSFLAHAHRSFLDPMHRR